MPTTALHIINLNVFLSLFDSVPQLSMRLLRQVDHAQHNPIMPIIAELMNLLYAAPISNNNNDDGDATKNQLSKQVKINSPSMDSSQKVQEPSMGTTHTDTDARRGQSQTRSSCGCCCCSCCCCCVLYKLYVTFTHRGIVLGAGSLAVHKVRPVFYNAIS